MNRKLSIVIVGILLIAVVSLAKHKDIVYTMSGAEYTGELVSITATNVVLATPDSEITFPKDSVRSIDMGRWRPGDDWKSTDDIDDSLLLAALDATSFDKGLRVKYPAAGYITIYEKRVLTIDADSSATIIDRKIYYIATERGKNKGNWSKIYFSDAMKVSVDFARAIGRDGTIYTIADNAIEDGSTNSWLSEYQRQRRKKFALKGAEIGAVVDYQTTMIVKKYNHFLNLNMGWNFYDTEPMLESIFEVKYAKNIGLKFQENNLPIKAKKFKDGDYLVRRYRMTDIDPYVREPMMPNLNWVLPNVKVSLPDDAPALSAAYDTKIAEATDAMDEVKSIFAEEFPDGKPTVEDVYNYVSQNYTKNWMGFYNYYPYPKHLSELLKLSQVAKHELSYLLYVFLKAAGYDPMLVMVGPDIDTKIPTNMFNIESFSYLTVKIDDGGTIRYLCPDEYTRYDHQTLNAVYILPIMEKGSKLTKLERLPGDNAYSIPKYSCKLNSDGTLDVSYTISYSGPTGGDSYRWHKNDKPRELENYFEKQAKNIDGMANLVKYKLTGYKDLKDKVSVSYRVSIPAYAVRAGEDILAFKLPTVKFDAYNVGLKERKLPFSLPGNIHGEKQITIELPDGYDVDFVPESKKLSVGYRSFIADIKVNGKTISYRQTTDGTDAPLIDIKKYPEYKSYVEDIAKFGDNWILIKKK